MKVKVEQDRVTDAQGNHVGTVLEKGGWRKKGRIYCFKCDKTVESPKHFQKEHQGEAK